MPNRQRVTIRDVAASAGVSQTTVSHVLNGKGRVEESTRYRVLAAAERLHYRPNAMARGTRSGVSHLLGFVVPATRPAGAWARTTYDAYADMALATVTAAAGKGFSIVLVPSDLPPTEVGHLLCDGIIDPGPRPGDALLHALRAWNVPTVLINRPAAEFDDGWWVGVDARSAVSELLTHLHSVGSRRIALVTGASPGPEEEAVEALYRCWATERGMTPQVLSVLNVDSSVDQRGTHDLLRSLREPARPDAIAAFGHGADVAVLRLAEEAGLRVPDDLRVASFLDTEQGRQSQPPITAIDAPIAGLADAAVELLVERLREGPAPDPPRLVHAKLMVRPSTYA